MFNWNNLISVSYDSKKAILWVLEDVGGQGISSTLPPQWHLIGQEDWRGLCVFTGRATGHLEGGQSGKCVTNRAAITKYHRFISPTFWRLDISDQGVSRLVSSFWDLFPWLIGGHLLLGSLHNLPSVCPLLIWRAVIQDQGSLSWPHCNLIVSKYGYTLRWWS
jgi:hypothetical protein